MTTTTFLLIQRNHDVSALRVYFLRVERVAARTLAASAWNAQTRVSRCSSLPFDLLSQASSFFAKRRCFEDKEDKDKARCVRFAAIETRARKDWAHLREENLLASNLDQHLVILVTGLATLVLLYADLLVSINSMTQYLKIPPVPTLLPNS